jgi:hypothetical protein
MDTTPIPPTEIMPTFLPSLPPTLFPPAPHHPQDSGMVFLSDQQLPDFPTNAATASIDPALQMQVFLNSPMEAMDPPQMHSAAPDFMPDLGTLIDSYAGCIPENVDLSPGTRTHSASPPQSIPSPSIHGTSSSYGAGVTSSLESALHPAIAAGGRSRANTSLSPPSIPSSFPSVSPPNLQASDTDYLPSLPSTSSLEESVSQTQPQTVIGKMLKK